jgi:hypothetical protein
MKPSSGQHPVVDNPTPRVVDAQLLTPRQGTKRQRHSHLFEREEYDHYVEPKWLSRRLFEDFDRSKLLLDPCTGWGRIAEAAKAAGYRVITADIVDRGYPGCVVQDFLKRKSLPRHCSVVCNPPFAKVREFICHALGLGARKAAMLYPIPRINAAWWWAQGLPLRWAILLTLRPSLPPGHVIAAGGKVKGGKEDFAWLVFEPGYTGKPQIRWLHRDGDTRLLEPQPKEDL